MLNSSVIFYVNYNFESYDPQSDDNQAVDCFFRALDEIYNTAKNKPNFNITVCVKYYANVSDRYSGDLVTHTIATSENLSVKDIYSKTKEKAKSLIKTHISKSKNTLLKSIVVTATSNKKNTRKYNDKF